MDFEPFVSRSPVGAAELSWALGGEEGWLETVASRSASSPASGSDGKESNQERHSGETDEGSRR